MSLWYDLSPQNLEKKYKSFSSDHKLLVETTQQLEQTQKALSDLQKEYDSLCHQVTETTRDLTDTVSHSEASVEA